MRASETRPFSRLTRSNQNRRFEPRVPAWLRSGQAWPRLGDVASAWLVADMHTATIKLLLFAVMSQPKIVFLQ